MDESRLQDSSRQVGIIGSSRRGRTEPTEQASTRSRRTMTLVDESLARGITNNEEADTRLALMNGRRSKHTGVTRENDIKKVSQAKLRGTSIRPTTSSRSIEWTGGSCS